MIDTLSIRRNQHPKETHIRKEEKEKIVDDNTNEKILNTTDT